MSGTHPSPKAALAVLLSLFFATLLFAPGLAAQAIDRDTFRSNFSQGLRLKDEKLMDKWMKRQMGAYHATQYFEELFVEQMGGQVDNSEKLDALRQSWQRSFEGNDTLQRLQRWVEGTDTQVYQSVQRIREQSTKLYRLYDNMAEPKREELMQMAGQFAQLARNAAGLGHKLEAAEQYGLAATVADKVSARDRTLEDRREILRFREELVAARDDWGFKFDTFYLATKSYIKDETVRIEEDEKEADKRRDEGYDDDIKGVEALVMPNVAAKQVPFKYAALKAWDKEIGYGPKSGMYPMLWWNVVCEGVGTSSKMVWFQAADIHFGRTGGNKFVIALNPDELEKGDELEVSSRPKPSTFYIDAAKELPYTMFFWMGSDRERVGIAECNVAPRVDYANAYYKSGASWTGSIGKDALTFYDDNCNGRPGESDPFADALKINTLGEWDNDGTVVPNLDSMRIGKGPRVPATQFVKLSDGWHLVEAKAAHLEHRPLNPEYFKTGKVKLAWKGGKKSAPSQVVIQGQGAFKTAIFDIADGKELEVPAGKYTVIFGRIVKGKGSRVQNATMYPGETHEGFVVEADKTTTVEMGAPFQITYTRRGDQNVSIDALKIFVQEKSGCIFTELHGMGLEPEVVWAKEAGGKGKVIAEFKQLANGDLVNEASKAHSKLSILTALFPKPEGYKEGPLRLDVKLPEEGLVLGLQQKKHSVFGKLEPVWK